MRFADVIFQPQGEFRPSKEQVIHFAKEVMRIDYEEFANSEVERFECENGKVKIYGEFRPVKDSKGCVILAHGFAQNRYILIPQEQMFRRLGFSTILFDQRAFGESKETCCTFGVEEAKDIVSLISWAKNRCGERLPIILFGVSMGAATVMNALNYTEDAVCVIEDCGFASMNVIADCLYQSLGMGVPDENLLKELELETQKRGFSLDDNRPIDVIRDKNTPICFIHGEKDSLIDVKHAYELFSTGTHPLSHLEIFEGKEHALCVTEREHYEEVIKLFLQKIMKMNLGE